MEPSFFTAIAKKLTATIIAVGSMFYSSINGVNAEFDLMELSTHGDRLIMSAHLSNCFSEDLDRIFKSGIEIRLYYTVELMVHGMKKPDSEYTFYHSVVYSLADQYYTVYLSEESKEIGGLSLDDVKLILSNVNNYYVLTANTLKDNREYFIRLTARLDKIQLPEIEEELNLMFYWNSLKPKYESPKFMKEMIIQ